MRKDVDLGVRLVLHGGAPMVAEATSILLSVLSSQQGVRLTLHNVAFLKDFVSLL